MDALRNLFDKLEFISKLQLPKAASAPPLGELAKIKDF